MIIAYAAPSLQDLGKVFDQMEMMEEFQLLARWAAEVGEVASG